jgi:hypothetical protein
MLTEQATQLSPQHSDTSSDSQAKAQLVARQIRVLLSAYRRDDFADPDGFVAQLGMILEQYPDDVIIYVTHPLTGIQRRIKFPPNIPEVVEACDDRVRHLEIMARPKVSLNREPLPLRRHEPGTDYFSMFAQYGRPLGPGEEGTRWEAHVGKGKGKIVERAKYFEPLSVDDLKEIGGLTDEQWDAIPDAKTYWKKLPMPNFGDAA